MNSEWVISVPCWGRHYINVFLKYCLPSLAISAKAAGIRPLLIVHSDGFTKENVPFLERKANGALDVEVRPVDHGLTQHDTYGDCHRDVMQTALPGQRVVLLNADIVVSPETFTACEKRFAGGKKLVVAAATRCLFKKGVVPPLGVPSRQLLAWTIGVKHPSVAQCFWGAGRSMIPWAIYFQSESGVVIRGFHLHPLALVKHESTRPFKGTSLDEHMIDDFPEEDIHVVTSPDELGLAELSIPAYIFKLLAYPMNEKSVFAWATHRATKRHRWLFEHRIVVSGTGDDHSDVAPCDNILEKLKWSRDVFNGPLLPHFAEVLTTPSYAGCKFVAGGGARITQ